MIDLANEYVASYKIVLELLDEIILVLGDDKTTIDQYSKILKVGLRNSELGKIPGTQDQVTFGDIDRSRSHKVTTVFIIGLNDGSFPSVNKEEGFLDDEDRKKLKQDGMELAKGTIEQLYEDNFNIYKAFTTAENKIYLSYTSSDKEGKSLRPSMLIHKIKKIYPNLQEKSDMIKKQYEIVNELVTYEELLENIAKLRDKEPISKIWYNLYYYYKEKKQWQGKLVNDLQGLTYTNLPQEIKKENSAEDIVPAQIPVTPLKGEMFVGIQKGSFKIFRDMGGRSKCSFNVVLKSELDKDIKVMALNLVYPKRVFAFVFKDVPSKQLQKRRITTAGDICYNMTNAPDINIHICKIKGTLASDCIKHIKWSDTLE